MKLTRILTLTTALLGAASAASAQSVSPVPAPTIITSAPYTITTPGYYQLGANLTVTNTTGAIITCAVGNVTLDFAGHYISGPSDTTSVTSGQLYGVYAYERGNIKVLNGTVAYCQTGIEFNGTGATGSLNVNQTVNNMLVTYCSNIGIFFNNASFSSILGCNVTNIGGSTLAGITANYGIEINGTGAVLQDSTTNTIAASPASTTSAYGIYVSATSTANILKCRMFSSNYGLYAVTNTTTAKNPVNYNYCIVNQVPNKAPEAARRVSNESNF